MKRIGIETLGVLFLVSAIQKWMDFRHLPAVGLKFEDPHESLNLSSVSFRLRQSGWQRDKSE